MGNNLGYEPFVPFVPHIGDRVTVRNWNDMVAQYGYLSGFEDEEYIRIPNMVIAPELKELCGEILIITGVTPNSWGVYDIVEVFYGDEEYIIPIYALKYLDSRDDDHMEIDEELDTYLDDIQIV